MTAPRYRHSWRWTTAALGAVLAVGFVAFILTRGPSAPSSEGTTAAVSDAADDLFTETSICQANLGGRSVEITYPAEWFAAGSNDAGCSWFGPVPLIVPEPLTLPPHGVAISLGAVPSPPREATDGDGPTGVVDGHEWVRALERTTEGQVVVRHVVYYIALDPTADEPTMVARTTSDGAVDPALNVEVLDRLVARLRFDD